MPNPSDVEVTTRGTVSSLLMHRVAPTETSWEVYGHAVGRRRPVAIAIAADVSGSMSDRADSSCRRSCINKLQALKEAAKNFLNNFSEADDAVAVVSFATDINVNYPLRRPCGTVD